MSFQLKLDLHDLPRLGRGTDFQEWKAAWQLALEYSELWDVITSVSAPKAADYAKKDRQARVMLMQAVTPEAKISVATYPSAREAWEAICKRFDRDTTNNVVFALQKVTHVRHTEGGDIREHIDTFDGLWEQLYRRCKSSSNEVATCLKEAMANDAFKGAVFLTTLPPSMHTVIENLSTRSLFKFDQIQESLRDMAELKEHESSSATAYWTRTAGKGASTKKDDSAAMLQANECSWCKKRGNVFHGHIYVNCNKLAQWKKENPLPPGKGKKSKGNDGTANAVDTDVYSTSPPSADAFLATDTDEVNTVVNANGKRFSSVSWCFDTGASRHMTGVSDDFDKLYPAEGTLTLANGGTIPVKGQGNVTISCRFPDGTVRPQTLTNVLYSPGLGQRRLFSWTYVSSKPLLLRAEQDDLFLVDTTGKHALWARRHGPLLEIQTSENATVSFVTYKDFHDAIGHGNAPLQAYADPQAIPPKPKDFHCEACALAKSTHSVPTSISPRASRPWEVIHCDLSGRFSTKSLSSSEYYLVMIDEFTRMPAVRFLKKKSDATQQIKDYLTQVQTQYGDIQRFCVKKLKADGGGEFVNAKLKSFLHEKGIILETSFPYAHESNGLAERMNRTLVTDARTSIREDRHLFLWPEAIATAAYLRSIKPHSALPGLMTPFERLHGKKPYIGHLRPFMTPCYVHIPPERRPPGSKFLDRAEKGFVVGFQGTKAYRVWIPTRNDVLVSRDVTFPPPLKGVHLEVEQVPVSTPSSSNVMDIDRERPLSAWTEDRRKIIGISPATAYEQGVQDGKISERVFHSTIGQGSPTKHSAMDQPTPSPPAHQANVALDSIGPYDAIAWQTMADPDIPSTIKQALDSPESAGWKEAIDREMAAHAEVGTWREVTLEAGDTPINCGWVFAKKYDDAGNLLRYKARLVARGNTQVKGVNYDETYSPVARYETLRLLLAIAVQKRWAIHTMDFDTAYLNSKLTHRVLIRPPPGFSLPAGKAYLLQRALYGLKQSGREWYGYLRTTLLEMGFAQMNFDPCVFRSPTDLIVMVYVDDLLLIGQIDSVEAFKRRISTVFRSKDLGRIRYLLGIEVRHCDSGIYIGQAAYAQRLLTRFRMENANPRRTPLDQGVFLAGRDC
jgi:Reverse transcriptase (RNA-dependent DNA polymerase)/gag-polypeptide of LTR copia-type